MERLNRIRNIFEEADRRLDKRRKDDHMLTGSIIAFMALSTAVIAAQAFMLGRNFHQHTEPSRSMRTR